MSICPFQSIPFQFKPSIPTSIRCVYLNMCSHTLHSICIQMLCRVEYVVEFIYVHTYMCRMDVLDLLMHMLLQATPTTYATPIALVLFSWLV